jgi:hypothetical protein
MVFLLAIDIAVHQENVFGGFHRQGPVNGGLLLELIALQVAVGRQSEFGLLLQDSVALAVIEVDLRGGDVVTRVLVDGEGFRGHLPAALEDGEGARIDQVVVLGIVLAAGLRAGILLGDGAWNEEAKNGEQYEVAAHGFDPWLKCIASRRLGRKAVRDVNQRSQHLDRLRGRGVQLMVSQKVAGTPPLVEQTEALALGAGLGGGGTR